MDTFKVLVRKRCNSEPNPEKKVGHFGHHFGTKVDKSQQKPEKIGGGKARRKKNDFRPLPN